MKKLIAAILSSSVALSVACVTGVSHAAVPQPNLQSSSTATVIFSPNVTDDGKMLLPIPATNTPGRRIAAATTQTAIQNPLTLLQTLSALPDTDTLNYTDATISIQAAQDIPAIQDSSGQELLAAAKCGDIVQTIVLQAGDDPSNICTKPLAVGYTYTATLALPQQPNSSVCENTAVSFRPVADATPPDSTTSEDSAAPIISLFPSSSAAASSTSSMSPTTVSSSVSSTVLPSVSALSSGASASTSLSASSVVSSEAANTSSALTAIHNFDLTTDFTYTWSTADTATHSLDKTALQGCTLGVYTADTLITDTTSATCSGSSAVSGTPSSALSSAPVQPVSSIPKDTLIFTFQYDENGEPVLCDADDAWISTNHNVALPAGRYYVAQLPAQTDSGSTVTSALAANFPMQATFSLARTAAALPASTSSATTKQASAASRSTVTSAPISSHVVSKAGASSSYSQASRTTSSKLTTQMGALQIINTMDGKSDGELAGNQFRITSTSSDGQKYDKTFVTDEHGKIYADKLPAGTYTVQELSGNSNKGYALSDKQELVVKAGMMATVKINTAKSTSVSSTASASSPSAPSVPKTGQDPTPALTALVTLLGAGAGCVAICSRRRKITSADAKDTDKGVGHTSV